MNSDFDSFGKDLIENSSRDEDPAIEPNELTTGSETVYEDWQLDSTGLDLCLVPAESPKNSVNFLPRLLKNRDRTNWLFQQILQKLLCVLNLNIPEYIQQQKLPVTHRIKMIVVKDIFTGEIVYVHLDKVDKN